MLKVGGVKAIAFTCLFVSSVPFSRIVGTVITTSNWYMPSMSVLPRNAKRAEMPVALSFTLDANGIT